MKNTIKLNSEFLMTTEEINQYNDLPDNLPENTLTNKQKDLVWELYRKYITKTIDNIGWSKDLFEIEKSEKWPSGPRVKAHEAKRIILNNLVYLNTSRKTLSLRDAVRLFHSGLTCRECYSKLLYNAYNIQDIY